MLSNNNNKLMVHMYIIKNTTIFLIVRLLRINKLQLQVSAINVGHLQVVHEALNDTLYLHVSGGGGGIYILWDGVGARSRFVYVEGVWIGSA